MLSSTNTIAGASLGLGCHDGWGCLLPWLENCLWGVVGLYVFGRLSMLALHFGGGRCGELSRNVCFCCPPVGGLFGCGGGCFHMLGHLVIEGNSSKMKLLAQSFKIISHRKF